MKAVVLLSGGLDSAVAAVMTASSADSIHTISFDYGQRHSREIESAASLAKYYKWPWLVLPVRFPVRQSALVNKTLEISGKIGERPASFVPGRNLVFLALAASYAYDINSDGLVGGWNIIDYPGYPDCRKGFINDAETAIQSALAKEVRIIAPVLFKTKAQIVQTGQSYKLPFELTWSCYEGDEKPCGKCSSCTYRREAFLTAGVEDPLEA